jgi:hypothetical protein
MAAGFSNARSTAKMQAFVAGRLRVAQPFEQHVQRRALT